MSKQAFDSLALRESLTETRASGQRVGGAVGKTRGIAFIVINKLKSWMREEFKLMISLMKHIVKLGHERVEGNPFS